MRRETRFRAERRDGEKFGPRERERAVSEESGMKDKPELKEERTGISLLYVSCAV